MATIYGVVADVGNYSNFVPFCENSILSSDKSSGQIDIKFGPIRHSWKSKLTYSESEILAQNSTSFPLKFLDTRLSFQMSESSHHILDDEFNEPEQARKIFIGNLPYEADEEMLKNHFSSFGEIVDCVVPKDPKTKFAKGFGFVTFTRGTAVDQVMNNRPHKVAGRVLEPKRAISRNESRDPAAAVSTTKLYIGSIGDLTESEIRGYFEGFGAIQEFELHSDKGQAFITFQDHDPVDRIVGEKHTVAGRPVETRKALTRFQIETATKRRESQQRRGAHDRNHRQHYGGHHPYGRPYDDEHGGYHRRGPPHGGYHDRGGYDRGYDRGGYEDRGYPRDRYGPPQERYGDPYARERSPPRGYDRYGSSYDRPPVDRYGPPRDYYDRYGPPEQNRYGGHPPPPRDSYSDRGYPPRDPPPHTHGGYPAPPPGPPSRDNSAYAAAPSGYDSGRSGSYIADPAANGSSREKGQESKSSSEAASGSSQYYNPSVPPEARAGYAGNGYKQEYYKN
ncbi:Oidioi.mRNA.OKI2018_I69.XSR.g14255.t1.cds [Oikopleura dioica]|uniref:Oidioi.mRNA.OKI2018_I69.XSR.g14255.t1.cds n=1 Tax=Oikopleura dioica TaxID=34765 RepID=A0ABN7S984_OIKDI|nr:Oidioi.mRNA.OKI2018_I69.XSR.g14255.t1.cds [Oikopleura dioica]